MLSGGLLASTGYAIHPFAEAQKIPTTYPVMSSDDLTQRKPAKWVVRTGWNSSQSTHALGDWVIKNTKYRKIATVAADYAFGWESVGGFQRTFEEGGGQIIQKVWVPLNTNDFAPFLSQVKRDSDAVFAVFFGKLALQFMKEYENSGLKGRVPLLSNGTTVDESVLPQMGDEALGTISTLHYSAALENPTNQRFAKAFETKAGKIPSYYAETCYTNARWIAEAIKAVSGKVEDREALLAALRKVELKDFPRGPPTAPPAGARRPRSCGREASTWSPATSRPSPTSRRSSSGQAAPTKGIARRRATPVTSARSSPICVHRPRRSG